MKINGFSKNEIHNLMWKKPQFAQIELTKNCNQSCSFCYRACDEEKKYVDKDYKEWIKVIDKLFDNGIHKLHFTGGEVVLFKNFYKILEYSKNKGFSIHINTNGTIDISQYLKFIDEVVFSVHGLKSMHNNIVRNNNSFDNILNNINKIKLVKNVDICINMVLIKENFNEILNVYNYFNAIIPNFKFSPTFGIKSHDGSEFSNECLEVNEVNMNLYVKTLKKINKENLVFKHGFHALFEYENKNNNYPIYLPVCAAGKDKLIIKYNGDVYPCNFFVSEEFFCGNIFQKSFDSVWNDGKGFKKFRDVILKKEFPEKCKKCKHNICYSGCRAWTSKYLNNSEDINYERDIRCEFTNAFIGN